MTTANTATYDARSHLTPIPPSTVRAVAGRRKLPESRVYTLAATTYSTSPFAAADRQLREEPEDYLADFLSGGDDDTDPALSAAAEAHTEGLREAMAYLDEAVNLVGVLLASMEDEGDSRAMQAETVLRIVEKKIDKAHTRIDRQESRHRKLFLKYAELKEGSEKGRSEA